MRHRKTMYILLRISLGGDEVHALAGYKTLERAEEMKGVYEQEYQEKGMFPMYFIEIQSATYYDE